MEICSILHPMVSSKPFSLAVQAKTMPFNPFSIFRTPTNLFLWVEVMAYYFCMKNLILRTPKTSTLEVQGNSLSRNSEERSQA